MAGNRVRYICPICDQELKLMRHFCWNCKSRVDEPWVFTGGHLPNEGHHEECPPPKTYMAPRSDRVQPRSHGGRSLEGKEYRSKDYTYNRPGQSTSTNTPRKKNTGAGSLFFVGFLFYFLIQVLLAFFRW